MVRMILRKENPFLVYVVQNNEIFVQIFEEHVKLIVYSQHDQEQSNKRKHN